MFFSGLNINCDEKRRKRGMEMDLEDGEDEVFLITTPKRTSGVLYGYDSDCEETIENISKAVNAGTDKEKGNINDFNLKSQTSCFKFDPWPCFYQTASLK